MACRAGSVREEEEDAVKFPAKLMRPLMLVRFCGPETWSYKENWILKSQVHCCASFAKIFEKLRHVLFPPCAHMVARGVFFSGR